MSDLNWILDWMISFKYYVILITNSLSLIMVNVWIFIYLCFVYVKKKTILCKICTQDHSAYFWFIHSSYLQYSICDCKEPAKFKSTEEVFFLVSN